MKTNSFLLLLLFQYKNNYQTIAMQAIALAKEAKETVYDALSVINDRVVALLSAASERYDQLSSVVTDCVFKE